MEFDLRTACGIEKVSYRCLTMNLYSFFIDNQAQVSVHLAKSCSERVLEIFDAVRGFYINSAPEIMEPFVWW